MTQTSQKGAEKGRAGRGLAVLGAGAWGTALAWLLAENGHAVRLWARRAELADELEQERENRHYAPGLRLPPGVRVGSDLGWVAEGAACAVVAVPSRALREVVAQLPPLPAFLSASKGLEVESFKRLTEVIAEYQPAATLAALSGPNLSREIIRGLPAAATVASHDAAFARTVQRWLSGPRFRVYRSRDLVGVEVAGAFKNVIALAAGLSDGLGFGDNAKATLITRGLAELVRLGVHLGGKRATFYGLAGLGDVVATCASTQSRNHQAGVRLARGATLAELEAERLTAEGLVTVAAVQRHAEARGLELPISTEVYRVVYQGKPPHQALHDLMGRRAKEER